MLRKIIFTLVVVLMFGMVSFAMLNDQIPVLNYTEASVHKGKFQIIGTPIEGKFKYDELEQVFSFNLLDDNNIEFNVKYAGVKPGNYDEATEIIAVGRFDRKNGHVIAERLLVKCPSKYEADGIEDYQTKEY